MTNDGNIRNIIYNLFWMWNICICIEDEMHLKICKSGIFIKQHGKQQFLEYNNFLVLIPRNILINAIGIISIR